MTLSQKDPSPQRVGSLSIQPERFQAWFTRGQPVRYKDEPRNGPHPWFILSANEDVNRGVFLSALMTHGARSKALGVEATTTQIHGDNIGLKDISSFDPQNIHTLTLEHIRESRSVLRVDPTKQLSLLKRARERFVAGPTFDSPWDLRRICTLRLDSDGRGQYGDLRTLEAALREVGVTWQAADRSFPAVIVASDQPARHGDPPLDPWNAVTVVPLLDSPALASRGAPQIKVTTSGKTLFALPRCVLTAHYRKPDKRRIDPDHPIFAAGHAVTPAELESVQSAIRFQLSDDESDLGGGDGGRRALEAAICEKIAPHFPPTDIEDEALESGRGALARILRAAEILGSALLTALRDAATPVPVPNSGHYAVARAAAFTAQRRMQPRKGLRVTVDLEWTSASLRLTLHTNKVTDIVVIVEEAATNRPLVGVVFRTGGPTSELLTGENLPFDPCGVEFVIRVLSVDEPSP